MMGEREGDGERSALWWGRGGRGCQGGEVGVRVSLCVWGGG